MEEAWSRDELHKFLAGHGFTEANLWLVDQQLRCFGKTTASIDGVFLMATAAGSKAVTVVLCDAIEAEAS